ncbi:MAG TPA: hypothetical protein VGM19_05545 [Armatimonadota bacterium]
MAPHAPPSVRERRTKFMMVGGLGVFAVAVMILLLFVLPFVQMTAEAQSPAPGAAPPAPGAPASGPPPMPGAPGAPGAASMPGAPGVPGAEAGAAAPAASGVPQSPLEVARPNPFSIAGAAPLPASVTKEYRTGATKYGPDWSRLPITLRKGFVRPERPPHPPPGPSAEDIQAISGGAAAKFSVSIILWTQGSPLATIEADGDTGSVAPGETFHGWRVVEIGQNYVIMLDPKTNTTQRLQLKGG